MGDEPVRWPLIVHGHLLFVHNALPAFESARVKGKTSRLAATLDTGRLKGWKGVMNKQEVTMHDTRTTNRLIAHEKALEAASIAI